MPAPVINPVKPIANQGGTINFTETLSEAGTWAVSAGSGSINSSTGVYTAPASVTNKQTAGGMQLLPNNHIHNVRIDSLSVHGSSGTWIAGAGTTPFSYLVFAGPNYADGTTPLESMVFFYTSANNGNFQIPAYPNFKLEHGWFNARTYNSFNVDHHSLVMDTTTGTMQEMYQYYPAGAGTSEGCPTCTSQSGVRYLNSDYALPTPTTDAAGLQLWPLMLRLQEVEQAIATAGTINHALRFTLQSGFCASSNIWPATTFATDGGTVPFGARARLKSSYAIGGFSSIAQILLTQLKQYGIILADGGDGWEASVEDTRWPSSIANAFQEIQNAAIAPSNFEFVDESGLMVSSSSGLANTSRETVTFTRTSDSATASADVVLRGVAVTLPKDNLNFMAGTPATQLTAFVNIGSVTWTMSPSVGSLTSGGLYTAPATATTPTVTTVTATSTTDAAVAAQLTLTVYSQTTIRLLLGQTSNYTDASSNIWYAASTLAAHDAERGFGTLAGYGYDNGGSWSGTDITIYEISVYSFGDIRFDFYVPNGIYTIVGKFANNGGSSHGDMIIEANGAAGSPIDVTTLAGGNQLPYDITNSGITVSNNRLSYVVRAVNSGGSSQDAPFIPAIQITKTANLPASASAGTDDGPVIVF